MLTWVLVLIHWELPLIVATHCHGWKSDRVKFRQERPCGNSQGKDNLVYRAAGLYTMHTKEANARLKDYTGK